MGRLKGGKTLSTIPPPKTKLASSSTTKSAPSTNKLLVKATQLIEQCDYELARKFLERILQSAPNNAEACELYGVVLIELGEPDLARKVRAFAFHRACC